MDSTSFAKEMIGLDNPIHIRCAANMYETLAQIHESDITNWCKTYWNQFCDILFEFNMQMADAIRESTDMKITTADDLLYDITYGQWAGLFTFETLEDLCSVMSLLYYGRDPSEYLPDVDAAIWDAVWKATHRPHLKSPYTHRYTIELQQGHVVMPNISMVECLTNTLISDITLWLPTASPETKVAVQKILDDRFKPKS
jgi:hypothetical protein